MLKKRIGTGRFSIQQYCYCPRQTAIEEKGIIIGQLLEKEGPGGSKDLVKAAQSHASEKFYE